MNAEWSIKYMASKIPAREFLKKMELNFGKNSVKLSRICQFVH